MDLSFSFVNEQLLGAVLRQYTLVRPVVSHVRGHAHAAGLAERIARTQPLARVVARHRCATGKAALVPMSQVIRFSLVRSKVNIKKKQLWTGVLLPMSS